MFDNIPNQSGPGWTLHHAECVERMRAMSPDSVDAILTDPPYHLTSIKARYGTNETRARLAGGFMGKAWDGGDVAFRVETWQAAYRVLKPGGYIMAFASSRGYHRMAVAIEDAGFITHPMIGWVFGCLDDQTCAVTREGVTPYHKLKEGQDILSYDPVTRSYQWDVIEEVVTYDIEDTAYRIDTDHGTQIVSRDHRCIVERNGSEVFERAQNLASEIRVPILESLPDLLEMLSNRNTQAETPRDVYPCVPNENACQQPEASRTQIENGHTLHGLQSADIPECETHSACEKSGLFVPVQRGVSWPGMGDTCPQGTEGVDGSIGSFVPGENDRSEQPGMERRSHVSSQARQLRHSEICSLPDGISHDVAGGRVCDGTSVVRRSGDRTPVDTDGSCPPSGPQPAKQSSRKPDAVCDEPGSQTVRTWQGHKTVVGRVAPLHYKGVIWCVRVRTGAFVAVRNGMAFPTGNSGFPKATDVTRFLPPEHAEQWQGWYYGGQVRKPALEPICVAQKPFSERNGALNILRWGVGAVNIDGCRVETTDNYAENRVIQGLSSARTSYDPRNQPSTFEPNELGRWPANLMHDSSPEVLALFPVLKARSNRNDSAGKGATPDEVYAGGWGDLDCGVRYNRDDPDMREGSAARFFECYPPVITYCPKANARDRLGSRHPTVKPMTLIRALVRHVTPPGGTVLDPFAGTGTTLRAAVLEDRRAIGIEGDAASVIDTVWRMRHATQPE